MIEPTLPQIIVAIETLAACSTTWEDLEYLHSMLSRMLEARKND